MKAPAALLLILGSALCAWTDQDQPRATSEAVDLVLPGSAGRVRIQLALQGQNLSAAWEAFLDRWFDYFDRDADGWLGRVEAARVFPLPASFGRDVVFDFNQSDTDKDDKIARAELKAFYRRAGFAPVQMVVEPPSLQDLQVGEALFRHLAPDVAGKLTEGKLKRADQLLRKLDENEDEVLTMAEVMSLGVDRSLKKPTHSNFQCVPTVNQPVAGTIQLALGDTPGALVRLEKIAKLTPLSPPLGMLVALRVRCGDAVLAFSQDRETAAKAVINSRRFVLAQFKNVAGSKAWVEKRQLADDASLQVLTDLFPHADRDQDGKLTLVELERFLSLLEQGAACTFLVTVADKGRNLHCHLDTNEDGRLDGRELRAAAQVLSEMGGFKEWIRSQVPHFARITIYRGHVGDSFGPLPLVYPTSAAAVGKPAPSSKGPAWFRAMDTNGDGYLSPAEFLGPAELFRRLDRNVDGLISPEEAEQA